MGLKARKTVTGRDTRDSSSPDAYLASVAGAQLEALQALRALVFDVAPEAEEEIGWGMLTYRLGDDPVFALAAQKHYVSLYVMNTSAVEENAHLLEGVSRGRSCLRFRRVGDVAVEQLRAVMDQAVRTRRR